MFDHSGYNVGITELRKKAIRNIHLLKMDEKIYDAGQVVGWRIVDNPKESYNATAFIDESGM